MIVSMEPVLKRGYTAWDRDVLPVDEFAERQAAVRALLAKRDLQALVVINYSLLGALFEYADIAYLGGLQTGGVLVLYRDRDPTLVTFGGGRELFFTREQTWIEDVLPGRGRTFEVARERLAAQGIAAGRIAVTGLDGMPDRAADRVREAFGGIELESIDDALRALRLVKRPRELLAIGVAKRIAEDATAAGLDAFASGGDNTDAMLAAERAARFGKARDVRVLASMDGTGLRPFEGRLPGRHEPLLLWVAAQYHGYWAEAAVTSGGGPDAGAAIEAMAATIRAGASAGSVAAAGLAALPEAARREARQHGFGGTIGLDRCDGIEITDGNATPLPEGAVVSLACFLPAATMPSIATRALRVTAGGCDDVRGVSLA